MPRTRSEKPRHVVLLDTREPPDVKLAIQAQLPDEIELVPLPEGDFALPDIDACLMGIERKTISDFLSSLTDGRLAKQLTRMKTSYKIQGLLVEGSYQVTGDGYLSVHGMHTRWTHTSFQMTLYSIQRQFPDLVVFWSNNLGTTAAIIRALASRGYKGCFDKTNLFKVAREGAGDGSVSVDRGRRPAGDYPARRVVRAP